MPQYKSPVQSSVSLYVSSFKQLVREKENQLSSRYDRGPLNSVIILRKRHNISERYYFGTRKHIEVKDGGREGGGEIGSGLFFIIMRRRAF